MVEGDAGMLSRGPPLRREREANPRRGTRRDSSRGRLHRPKDTSFGSHPEARLGRKLLGVFLGVFTPN